MTLSIDTLSKIPTLRRKMAYVPFAGRVGGPRIGLQPLPEGKAWFEYDEDREVQLELKSRILDHDRSCCQALPGTQHVVAEVVDEVAAWLAETRGVHVPAWGRDSLFAVSKAVQDDLCVVHEGRFVAGSVCFPTGWVLAEKLGRNMRKVHEGVGSSEFRDVLADKVAGAGEQVLWRTNWFLYASPRLQHGFQNRLYSKSNVPQVTPENAGSTLYIRYERQTLRRFPETGAVLFTIRVYVDPLRTLREEHPEYVQDFVEAYRKHKPDGPWVEPMFQYLGVV